MKRRPVTQATTSTDLAALAEIVERFSTKTVVLYGDFVADEFQYGELSRVSREAPVLILKHRETHVIPGGGANAANNLAALGARVFPVSVIGDDSAGSALTAYFRERGISTSGIFRAKGWATPTKTRFLAGWAHTVGQQVLRVDREPETEFPAVIRQKLQNVLSSSIKKAHALAISDYGFGVASPASVQTVLKRSAKALVATVDARYALQSYARCGLTAATPNEAELEALHHAVIGKNSEALQRFGSQTLSKLHLKALLVTRGRDGMALFEKGKKVSQQIPVHGSDQAVDVTGAGDTVLAAFTLSLASGASYLEAAQIANIAGGLVVMKRGTATVSQEELRSAIRHDVSGDSQ